MERLPQCHLHNSVDHRTTPLKIPRKRQLNAQNIPLPSSSILPVPGKPFTSVQLNRTIIRTRVREGAEKGVAKVIGELNR